MPLNESRSIRRSNLTREQIRQAELAIYGLQEIDLQPQRELSHDEIQQMRAIIARHDNGHKPLKEFDLNNPPREPYKHQEFPRVMYHHGKRTTRLAQDADEMQLALDAGWKKEPFSSEPDSEIELSAEELAEVAKLDAEARKPKKK